MVLRDWAPGYLRALGRDPRAGTAHWVGTVTEREAEGKGKARVRDPNRWPGVPWGTLLGDNPAQPPATSSPGLAPPLREVVANQGLNERRGSGC